MRAVIAMWKNRIVYLVKIFAMVFSCIIFFGAVSSGSVFGAIFWGLVLLVWLLELGPDVEDDWDWSDDEDGSEGPFDE